MLPNIVHHNQSAYVKGRTVSDVVRTIEDVMEFSKRYNIEGRMICIDFKKAFDTVSRDFYFAPCPPLALDHHSHDGSTHSTTTSQVAF